jgi:hypothetical protein
MAMSVLLLAVSGLCQPRPAASADEDGRLAISARQGSPLLLAFLALTADNGREQSRAVSVVLDSLDHQYGSRGLRVAAIDASVVVTHRASRHEEVVNTAADWNLKFPVLEDANGGSAQAFHIRSLPTLILVSATGREIGRWQGYTRTPIVAQAIERVLGGPLAALPDSNTASSYQPAR